MERILKHEETQHWVEQAIERVEAGTMDWKGALHFIAGAIENCTLHAVQASTEPDPHLPDPDPFTGLYIPTCDCGLTRHAPGPEHAENCPCYYLTVAYFG